MLPAQATQTRAAAAWYSMCNSSLACWRRVASLAIATKDCEDRDDREDELPEKSDELSVDVDRRERY